MNYHTCPCMRFLTSRSFILAAGLFVMVGALIFAGVTSFASKNTAGDSACCSGPGGDTSCQKIHTLLRKNPSEEAPARFPTDSCCPASPARPAAPAGGIQ